MRREHQENKQFTILVKHELSSLVMPVILTCFSVISIVAIICFCIGDVIHMHFSVSAIVSLMLLAFINELSE